MLKEIYCIEKYLSSFVLVLSMVVPAFNKWTF